MVLTVPISQAAELKLAAKARAAGVDVETYAARHLELMARPPRLLVELSGPIGEHYAHSGLNEDDLSDFLEAEKHAMRVERRAERPV